MEDGAFCLEASMDGENMAVFRITAQSEQEAGGMLANVRQAAEAQLLALEDKLSEVTVGLRSRLRLVDSV